MKLFDLNHICDMMLAYCATCAKVSIKQMVGVLPKQFSDVNFRP
nr:hypothetical protein [Pedobacter panaciterrae]